MVKAAVKFPLQSDSNLNKRNPSKISTNDQIRAMAGT